MTQVVDFAQMKKNREEKLAPKKTNTNITSQESSTESKFVMLGDNTLSFGGAFSRELIKNLNERKNEVIEALICAYNKELLKLGVDISGKGGVVHLNIADSIKVIGFENAIALAENLEKVEDFDYIFDEEIAEAMIGIPNLVFAIITVSFTHLDMLRMAKNNYYMVDCELEEFMVLLSEKYTD